MSFYDIGKTTLSKQDIRVESIKELLVKFLFIFELGNCLILQVWNI
jgi:hypothetical protein